MNSRKFIAALVMSIAMMASVSAARAEIPYDPVFSAEAYAPSVSTQLGGFINQLNAYDQAFMNMDMYMLNSKAQRKALKKKKQISKSDIVSDTVNAVAQGGEVWTNPYVTIEKVPFKHGPKVSNYTYGQYFGVETDLVEFKKGWDGVFGVYGGYNGSHQHYDGVSIYENGGTLGLVGMAYKDNYFAGLTVNVSSSGGVLTADGDHLNFGLIGAGIAAKTGYNWELAGGKFIIQPNYKMSYSFVNVFNQKEYYDINPLNVINIEPEIKFIGNFKNGWQPYAAVSMVWNILDRSRTYIEDAMDSTAKIQIKPYVKYGIGVRKAIGERLTGFIQTYFTNGGRNSVGFQLGLSWTLGKKPPERTSQAGTSSLPEKPKTVFDIKNVKTN